MVISKLPYATTRPTTTGPDLLFTATPLPIPRRCRTYVWAPPLRHNGRRIPPPACHPACLPRPPPPPPPAAGLPTSHYSGRYRHAAPATSVGRDTALHTHRTHTTPTAAGPRAYCSAFAFRVSSRACVWLGWMPGCRLVCCGFPHCLVQCGRTVAP